MDTDTVCRQRLWSYDLTALYKSIVIIIIIIIYVNLTSALLIVATAYQLKSTDFTVMSINLADELGNKQLFILQFVL